MKTHPKTWIRHGVFGLTLLTVVAAGVFKADPEHISPTETKVLALRCTPDIPGDSSVLAVQIKKVVEDATLGRGRRARRAAGSTFYRATLTTGNVVGIVPDIDRFKGEGKTEHPAYLKIMMSQPDADDAGSYECDVTLMGANGVEVKKETITVTSGKVMSLESLDRRIETLEHQVPAMSAIGQSMQHIVEEDREKNKALALEVESLKKENKDLVQSVAELMKKFQSLSDRTTALMEEQKLQMTQLKKTLEIQKQQYRKQQQQLQQQQEQQTHQQQQQQQQPYRQQQQPNPLQQSEQSPNNVVPGSYQLGTVTGGIDSTGGAGQPPEETNPGGAPINNNNNKFYNNNAFPNNGYMRNNYNGNGFNGIPLNGNNYNNYNNGYNRYANANQYNNPYQETSYNNNGRGYPGGNFGAPPYRNYPYNNDNNNNINNNNYGGQIQPQGFGNGFQPGIMPQPNNLPRLKSDDLFKIQSRMDDLEKTRLTAIERQVAELRHKWVEPMAARVDAMDLYINGTLVPKLNHFVDQADFDDIQNRFIRLEGDVLPHMVNNITSMQRHMATIHRAMDLLKGLHNASDDEIVRALKEVTNVNPSSPPVGATSDTDFNTASTTFEENQEETSSGSSYASVLDIRTTVAQVQTTTLVPPAERTTVAQTTKPESSRRCYVCGNKEKNESCTRTTNDDESQCLQGQDYCMTDVYEDGRVRHIYKRCATRADCKEMRLSSVKCVSATFLTLTPMICHFCCVSDLCNNSIRPTKDLYRV